MKALGQRSIASFLMMLLNVSLYFMGAVLALTVCLAALMPFIAADNAQLGIPVSFTVDGQALKVAAPSLNVTAARISKARGELQFPPPGKATLAVPALVVVAMLAFAIWVIDQLRAVLRTLRAGQPFAPANAARIRWIGFAVIGGELARAAIVWRANSYVVSHFSAEGLRFDARPDLSMATLVSGLIILVIAEVFRVGTRLDEDQSLTI